MDITSKIEELRAYALTAKTAIYNEDAMTSIELAGVTACKVNECVNAINSIVDIIDNVMKNSVKYNADTEELTIT